MRHIRDTCYRSRVWDTCTASTLLLEVSKQDTLNLLQATFSILFIILLLILKQRYYFCINADSATDGTARIFAYYLMPLRDSNPR